MEEFYLPVVFGLIAESTSVQERGMAMGLKGTLRTSGSAIGVLTLMNLADIFSIRSSLAGFGGFVVIFSGIILIMWKRQA
ncbi:hypothetical protein AKJ46_00210 [candidate division MSBL1 archaeon SCGC-AAA833K04]|uniref:Major facilitator superfamily (MFS) profile domain-containing protein n=1 Tax=candidate division MSBL1 archaeon SCGC-AAA833K04 TaxID=1698258 RepID=A0A133VSW0_9EURY|nr:hypothetical protein AKJ46_00210 [candidate division MSBL1 archaeon SCGC-AAA833K04]